MFDNATIFELNKNVIEQIIMGLHSGLLDLAPNKFLTVIQAYRP